MADALKAMQQASAIQGVLDELALDPKREVATSDLDTLIEQYPYLIGMMEDRVAFEKELLEIQAGQNQ